MMTDDFFTLNKVQKAVCDLAYGEIEDAAQRLANEQISKWKKNIKGENKKCVEQIF